MAVRHAPTHLHISSDVVLSTKVQHVLRHLQVANDTSCNHQIAVGGGPGGGGGARVVMTHDGAAQ